MNKNKKSQSQPIKLSQEEEIANNLHKDILNKINQILHRKTLDDDVYASKLKKSTVLCFDDISIANNDQNFDEFIGDFQKKVKSIVGDFVNWNSDKPKVNTANFKFSDPQFISKFLLNKAFIRENTIKPIDLNNLNLPKNSKNLRNLVKQYLENNPKSNKNAEIFHRKNNSLDIDIIKKMKMKFILKNDAKIFKNNDFNLLKPNNNSEPIPVSKMNESSKKFRENFIKKLLGHNKKKSLKMNDPPNFSQTFQKNFNSNDDKNKQNNIDFEISKNKTTSNFFLTGISSSNSIKNKFNFKIDKPIVNEKNDENFSNDLIKNFSENGVKNKLNKKLPPRKIFLLELAEKKELQNLQNFIHDKDNNNKIMTKKFLTPHAYKEKLTKNNHKKTRSMGLNEFLISNNKEKEIFIRNKRENFDEFNKIKDRKNENIENKDLLLDENIDQGFFDSEDKNSINLSLDKKNGSNKIISFEEPSDQKKFSGTFYSLNKLNKKKNLKTKILLKTTDHKIRENYKKVIGENIAINRDLRNLYSYEQNTIGMRYELMKNSEKLEKNNYDYLDEKINMKEKNYVKGVPNPDSNEMIYIDENKANIINHIDGILKMRNENFYKFKNVCVEKYVHYARKNDIFEYTFGNNRYIPKENYKNIDKNTEKLKKIFAKMKTTNMNIKKILEARNKQNAS